MADIDRAFANVAKLFKINDFNEQQKTAIRTIVEENSDLFVNLPTGFGKSLIFQAIPLIFDCLRTDNQGHIVVVVSPLINLITDQVSYLQGLGITAINISGIEDEGERQEVEKGSFQVVYGTPEAWLLNERWRNMLKNSTYTSKLCAVAVDEAHVIKQWGMSTNSNLAPFRECYSRLHEFRSLTPSAPMIALTATATKATRNAIFDVLMMVNPKVIFESPNKANVIYSVQYMAKDTDLEYHFDWLTEELKEQKEQCQRTIIYCQTIMQSSLIYATLKGMLGKELYMENGNKKSALIEMLHSCTPMPNKENILTSFSESNGTIRVLIATIAFGMGVNCKGVTRIVHFGPSKNIESYTQETGRAGRDGTQSTAFLLFNGLMLAHVEADIKSYVMNEQCRRAAILKHFEKKSSDNTQELHFCCDYCSKKCQCGLPECGKLTTFPTKQVQYKPTNKRAREVTKFQREHVHNKLTIYYKTLLRKLLNTTANTDVKTLTAVPYLLGFSETQIQQVLENLEHLFSLKDICDFIEIWDMQHARKILIILKEEFQDTEMFIDTENDEFEFDDVFLEDWEALLEDNDLFEMAFDNLSVSQLQDSFTAQSTSALNVSEIGISQAVLETIERIHVSDQL